MPHFICTTCSTQYAASEDPPAACAICQDERQFVGWSGQRWTTLLESPGPVFAGPAAVFSAARAAP